MALFTNYTGITSLIYAGATVIIRYVYVSSSLKPNVQAVFKVSESNGWDVKHLALFLIRLCNFAKLFLLSKLDY